MSPSLSCRSLLVGVVFITSWRCHAASISTQGGDAQIAFDADPHGAAHEPQLEKLKLSQASGHPSIGDYQIRFSEPDICDTGVKQYSGYLDISQSRHLFFWFFEARNDPENAPLMLWHNGGPGSSTIGSGLLFENGPCSVSPAGNETLRNPHSWNEKVNIIYIDSPAGTGYSYTDDDSTVSTLDDLAVDIHAFLQLWFHSFPKYAMRPFHLALESWGGHYGPHIANYIFKQNQDLEVAPRLGQVKINLASLILANGLTEPLSQFSTIEKYLCGGAPYPAYNSTDAVCRGLRIGTVPCLGMIDICYRQNTRAACYAATTYCVPAIFSLPLASSGKNPYDLRKPCPMMNSHMCYDGLEVIEHFLNRTETKKSLGVDPKRNFEFTNNTINSAFYDQGEAMRNSAALLPELVNNGMRLLAYAGDTDGVCNYQGIELWMERLHHRFHGPFGGADTVPWYTKETKSSAGTVRQAGNGAGNVTFVRVFDAGHLAPFDQPEATLDMISRWVDNVPFSD